MSQHDYDITTADANTGSTMRAAINAALQALAGNNSGATEPATKYPYMWWADTTSGYLKQRNAANSAWITVMLLATALMSNSDKCDGFHASQTAAAGRIPVTAATTGNLPLIDDAAVLWGDGSCKISGSGSTDIITLTGALSCTGSMSASEVVLSGSSVNYIRTATSDGSDTAAIAFTHGSASANSARGAYAIFAGNEYTVGLEGSVRINAGNVSNGYIQLTTGGGFVRFKILYEGRTLTGVTLPVDDGVNAWQLNGDATVSGCYKVDGVQVVGNRVVDARVDDTINTSAWDSTTAGVLDALRDAMITHGLMAAA